MFVLSLFLCARHTIQNIVDTRRTHYPNLSVWYTDQMLIWSSVQHKYNHIMQCTSCDTIVLHWCKHNKEHCSRESHMLLRKLHNMQSRDEFYNIWIRHAWLWYFGQSDLAEIQNQAANRCPRAVMRIIRNHNSAHDEYTVALAPLKCREKLENTYASSNHSIHLCTYL